MSGTVTEVEKGSAAERFWVGMGAGQERVVGEYANDAPVGVKFASFTARKSYQGDVGIGGWDT